MRQYFIRILLLFFIIVSLSLTLLQFVLPMRVHMNSMNNALYDGDFVLLGKLANKIRRGDILVFKLNNRNYIKRCIGIPGDTVSSKNDTLIINNKRYIPSNIFQKESFIDSNMIDPNKYLPFGHMWTTHNFGPYIIPKTGINYKSISSQYSLVKFLQIRDKEYEQQKKEINTMSDYYFFIGDNMPVSVDSRAFGPISKKNIVGKVLFVIYSPKGQNKKHWFLNFRSYENAYFSNN